MNIFLCFFGTMTIGTFLKDFIYLLLERGEGREKEKKRNINVIEKHRLVACCTCLELGTEPENQAHAFTRNQPGNLSFCGTMPNQLSHPGQGPSISINLVGLLPFCRIVILL